jgi:hypothetical protein
MLFQSSAFTDIINYSGQNMNQLSFTPAEVKSEKPSSAKKNLQASSGSASSTNSNGVYVDLGKSLLEAAKAGDAEQVQSCIKNGAPFITDWVRQTIFSLNIRFHV